MVLPFKTSMSYLVASLLRFFLSCLLLINCSCEIDFGLDECNKVPPAHGDIIFKLTLDQLNPSVSVQVYEGYIDDGELVDSFTTDINTVSKYYRNGQYSAIAKYRCVHNNEMEIVNIIAEGFLGYISNVYADKTCYEEGELELDLTHDKFVE